MPSPYTDDPTGIPSGSWLIRRIAPPFVDWSVVDGAGHPRVTKEAVQFYDQARAQQAGCPAPALSIIVESLADDLEILKARYPGVGLARVRVDTIREGGSCGAQLWPTAEEAAHAIVFRIDGGNRPSDGSRKRWAAELTANWLVPPPRP